MPTSSNRMHASDYESVEKAKTDQTLEPKDLAGAPRECEGSHYGTPSPALHGEYLDRNTFQAYGLNAYGPVTQHFDAEDLAAPPTRASFPPIGVSYAHDVPSGPGFGLTWSQASQALALFKVKMMPEFPFVVLERDVFAEQLCYESPLLFRSIMLAAAPVTLAQRKEMKRSISAYIGQRIIVLEERDLDLLQGLLVFIAWGNHSFYLDRYITNLIYLAVGLAHNLGITRLPPSCQQKVKQAVGAGDVDEAMRGRALTTVAEEFHTLEEMRAFLGCYYVLSVNSSQFCRQNSLQNDYMKYCLQYVTDSGDYWPDSYLVRMIRLQQVVDRISATFPAGSESGVPVQSLMRGIQPIHTQINEICGNIEQGQVQNMTFWMKYNYVLVRLYEPATRLSTTVTGQNALHRSQHLTSCLQAVKSFFTFLLSSTPADLLYRPFTCSAELITVTVTASRLLLLDVDGWDLDAARQTLDLVSIMDELIAAFDNASLLQKRRAVEPIEGGFLPKDNPDDEKEDVFIKYVHKIKWIKVWFQTQLVARGLVPPSEPDVVLPDVWSLDENAGNQFWLGLVNGSTWGSFEF
ncbi:hypothetical protein JX265_004395 [Neoarthrinium moseri]|uniref:Transcription factor domain-containing protein n=1 Tax=Neoarthrinium moseri TaxID=1658444 RepID=A0A9Q0ASV9_9PEZI|nr:hypothetical protein JX265_004395 [Neoarthrinium moseri]